MQSAPVEADRSIPELLQRLGSDTSLLVRQELELARAELVGTLKRSREPAIAFGIAGIIALAAFGALTITFIAALSLALPVWASALIVTILYAVIAAAAIQRGRSALKSLRPVPEQTIKTVKEDVAAVKTGIDRGR